MKNRIVTLLLALFIATTVFTAISARPAVATTPVWAPSAWAEFDSASNVTVTPPLSPCGNSHAVQLVSTGAIWPAPGADSGVEFTPPSTMTFGSINTLSTYYEELAGTLYGGSPRFALYVQNPLDHTQEGEIWVYIGTPPNFVDNDVGLGWLNTGNLVNPSSTDLRWDTSQLSVYGGAYGVTYSQALSVFGTWNVLWIDFVVDGGWHISQTFLADNIMVNAYEFALVQLTVVSPHDSPVPSGTTLYKAGDPITASVTSPAVGTNLICTGWTGTGSAPATGTGKTVTFTITQDSMITWNWVYGPPPGTSVGGQWTPITMQALSPLGMLGLLAPWVALALMAAATAIATYRRLLKKHW